MRVNNCAHHRHCTDPRALRRTVSNAGVHEVFFSGIARVIPGPATRIMFYLGDDPAYGTTVSATAE